MADEQRGGLELFAQRRSAKPLKRVKKSPWRGPPYDRRDFFPRSLASGDRSAEALALHGDENALKGLPRGSGGRLGPQAVKVLAKDVGRTACRNRDQGNPD